MKELNVLILDDEQRVRDEIEEFLTGNKFPVFKAELPSQAFKILDTRAVDGVAWLVSFAALELEKLGSFFCHQCLTATLWRNEQKVGKNVRTKIVLNIK